MNIRRPRRPNTYSALPGIESLINQAVESALKKQKERIYDMVAEINQSSKTFERRSQEIAFMQGYIAAQGDILKVIDDIY
jgi:methyl-accepting chemotaxis protein